MTLSAGARLGPYEIRDRLGAGGMGEVYRAWDARLGREVALKVLPAPRATDLDRVRRFEQEARAAGGLSTPARKFGDVFSEVMRPWSERPVWRGGSRGRAV